MNTPRNIVAVIDQLTGCEPDLKEPLASLRSSCEFSPPEMMGARWNELAAALTFGAMNHPQRDELRAIFAGEREPAQLEGDIGASLLAG